jgi:hypothetical protein
VGAETNQSPGPYPGLFLRTDSGFGCTAHLHLGLIVVIAGIASV